MAGAETLGYCEVISVRHELLIHGYNLVLTGLHDKSQPNQADSFLWFSPTYRATHASFPAIPAVKRQALAAILMHRPEKAFDEALTALPRLSH